MQPLPQDFYRQDTVGLAKALLGKVLTHRSPDGITSGRIVETEAYLGSNDPASHAFRGPTNRNRAMFGPPGHAYIYFTYGMHYCLNVTAEAEGRGEAVLIRALEPVMGIELMRRRRGIHSLAQLCNGPAKLVEAMGVTKSLYGHDLSQPPLWIGNDPRSSAPDITTATRVGIKQAADRPLRFYIAASPFVSRP